MPASSPVASTFPMAAKAASPVPGTSQRPPSSRAQQTSTQITNGRQRPSSSASIRMPNASTSPGTGLVCLGLSNQVPLAGRSTADSKSSATKDSANSNTEPASATAGANGEAH